MPRSLTEYEFEFQAALGSVIIRAKNIRDALVALNSSRRDSANDDRICAPGVVQHLHCEVRTPITEDDLIRVTCLDFNDDKDIEAEVHKSP